MKKFISFITKPFVLIGGVVLGIILLLGKSASPSNSVNTELEGRKIDADTTKYLADAEVKKSQVETGGKLTLAVLESQTALGLANTQANRDIRLSELEAGSIRMGFQVDLLKTLDTNSTEKNIALAGINAGLLSDINSQNKFANIALVQSENEKILGLSELKTTEKLGLANIASNERLNAQIISSELQRDLSGNDTLKYLANLDVQKSYNENELSKYLSNIQLQENLALADIQHRENVHMSYINTFNNVAGLSMQPVQKQSTDFGGISSILNSATGLIGLLR